MDGMKWRRSSRSGNGGNTCVEVARVPGSTEIAARDSQLPAHPFLRFPADEWTEFLDRVKRGRLDL